MKCMDPFDIATRGTNFKNLTGQKFGHLTVKRFVGAFPGNGCSAVAWWECECDCDDHNTIITYTSELTTGRRVDCGCGYNKNKTLYTSKDLTGQQFGRFIAETRTTKPDNIKHRGTHWLCRCITCGRIEVIRSDRLQKGVLCRTCDADLYHKSRELLPGRKRLTNIWHAMNQRCNDPHHKSYYDYGGRGIKVCWRWHEDNPDGLENFISDAYANGFKDQPPETKRGDALSIDRIDVDGDYTPENTRWIQQKLQIRNTRRNRFIIDQFGNKMIFKDFEDKYGVDDITGRLTRGWSLNAVVELAKRKASNPGAKRLITYRKDGTYRDHDGFMIMIHNYGNPPPPYTSFKNPNTRKC